jgi:hypothetical protein
VADPVDDLSQVTIGIRPDHQVHTPHLSKQPVTDALGHAAGDAEHEIGTPLPVSLQLSQPSEHPLLGVLPDRTRIHEDHIGLIRVVDAHEAVLGEDSGHELGVADVHLAAVRLDVDAARSRSTRAARGGGR